VLWSSQRGRRHRSPAAGYPCNASRCIDWLEWHPETHPTGARRVELFAAALSVNKDRVRQWSAALTPILALSATKRAVAGGR
jgi:hypothetical protein